MPLPPGFSDVDAVIAELSRDPAIAGEIARARQELVEAAPDGAIRGLAAMRLRHGLSQKQLAEAIGTKQPHIARLEAGDQSAYVSTLQRIAKALNEPIDKVIKAFLEALVDCNN
jgi:DNA-binding XRE family transcriptional regulator